MLDPTPPVDATHVARRASTNDDHGVAGLTTLAVAIVNADRDVKIASIEDAGKTRRLILRFVLPLGVTTATLVLGGDGVLLQVLRSAKNHIG